MKLQNVGGGDNGEIKVLVYLISIDGGQGTGGGDILSEIF